MKRSLLLLLLLSSCFSRGAAMTRQNYDDIQVGTSISSVEDEVGSPYAVRSKGGTEEYEYVERIDMNNSLIAENHYFIIVIDGKVVGKYMRVERAPAFDLIYQEDPNYNSYP